MDAMLSPDQTPDREKFPPSDPAASPDTVRDLAKLLSEHRGMEVTALDLREINGWTDFFVIATVSSAAHLQGLERHIKEFCGERDIAILRGSRRSGAAEEEWRLIDLGFLVVHLMNRRTRDFYELERLWSAAPVIYRDPGTAPLVTP
jgi:ribosome-associated protein